MDQMIWKNKIALLWIFQVLNFIAVLTIPESLAVIVEEVGEALGLLIAFYFFLSCLMMFLAVFTKPSLSRWPTLVVGIFFAFVKIQWIINALTGDMVVAQFFTEIWGLIAAAMIVWYAWKVPEPQNRD